MRIGLHFRLSGAGTSRHIFSMLLLQKLLAKALLITCAELWLEKISALQKTPSKVVGASLLPLFTPPPPVIITVTPVFFFKTLNY